MTEPTPTPAVISSEVDYALRCKGANGAWLPDIVLVYRNGLVRPCLPVEWAVINGPDGTVPVVEGTQADYTWAQRLVNAIADSTLDPA